MNTVATALGVLVVPVLVALCVSAALRLLGVVERQWPLLYGGVSVPERIVNQAEADLRQPDAQQEREKPAPEGRPKVGSNADGPRPQRRAGGRGRLSRLWTSAIPIAAIGLGCVGAISIGAYILYVPMVAIAYRSLYEAYCESDAVATLLAKRVSLNHPIAFHTFDACVTPRSTEALATALSQSDVFDLLKALGMLEAREKSPETLFADSDTPTQNHLLATFLSDPAVYVPGTPTSALLVHLAQRIGSNEDVSSGGADGNYTVCRTAGLSAVLAQQPFAYRTDTKNDATKNAGAVGRGLLRAGETLDMKRLIELNGGSPVCFGDAELSKNGLGREFSGVIRRNAFPWPLMSRPDDIVSDGEITSIALAWARWVPKGDKLRDQKPVLEFMRNMVSEVSATPDVRDGRIAANFFVGPERLAILIVSTFLVFCLLWQQAKGIDDERDLNDLREVIELARAREASNEPKNRLLVRSLEVLGGTLYRRVGRSGPRELLDAAIEMVAQKKKEGHVDRDRLRRAAQHELRIIDNNRFFFLAGLPLLPTIGFIGTVHSLIEALAIADNIPRARDAVDQAAAVSNVTAVLSLCFSTTFMALTALLVFAPIDLWQSTQERRIVEEAERLLDDSLLSGL